MKTGVAYLQDELIKRGYYFILQFVIFEGTTVCNSSSSHTRTPLESGRSLTCDIASLVRLLFKIKLTLTQVSGTIRYLYVSI